MGSLAFLRELPPWQSCGTFKDNVDSPAVSSSLTSQQSQWNSHRSFWKAQEEVKTAKRKAEEILEGVQTLSNTVANGKKQDDQKSSNSRSGSGSPITTAESKPAVKRRRIVWTEALHQRFVAVVDKLGVENAVPRRIQEEMRVDGLTREMVASHLQKYRARLRKEAEGMRSNHRVSEEVYQWAANICTPAAFRTEMAPPASTQCAQGVPMTRNHVKVGTATGVPMMPVAASGAPKKMSDMDSAKAPAQRALVLVPGQQPIPCKKFTGLQTPHLAALLASFRYPDQPLPVPASQLPSLDIVPLNVSLNGGACHLQEKSDESKVQLFKKP